ncbi:MAG: hypothetical protein WCG27_03305, partial [Pseudomonadota bacterium]
MRDLLQKQDYQAAHRLLGTNSFYKEENSRLLYFLEQGLVHHLEGHYYQSVLYLMEADQLAQKLFTVSLTSQGKAMIANDNYDKYYGESYERSLVHFYLSLNHYLLFQQGFYEAYLPDGAKEGQKDAKYTLMVKTF